MQTASCVYINDDLTIAFQLSKRANRLAHPKHSIWQLKFKQAHSCSGCAEHDPEMEFFYLWV
ncbi:hypothetical protein T10_7981 [Trichinella papuae]|uniref:Uncharacterized protein n=1 Tax=Trichinella papuae TaxID=268474 RepID=A0A0V1MHM2_9BILA|nr:hypothetical protein T10_7981 [Trichinella papuae]